jgi:hypothetical protein
MRLWKQAESIDSENPSHAVVIVEADAWADLLIIDQKEMKVGL